MSEKPTPGYWFWNVDYCTLELGILANAMEMQAMSAQKHDPFLAQLLGRTNRQQNIPTTIFEPWKLSNNDNTLPHVYYVSKGENGLKIRNPWEEACSDSPVYTPRSTLAGPWRDQGVPSDAADPYNKTAIAKLIQAETGPFALARQRAAFGACEESYMSIDDVKDLLETLRAYENARGGMTRPRQEALDLADCWDEECAAYERMRSQRT